MVAGCFLANLGAVLALADRSLNFTNPSVRLFFMTDFLGGLTTFSTYAPETVNFCVGGTYLVTTANFLTNDVVGAALVLMDMWIGRLR